MGAGQEQELREEVGRGRALHLQHTTVTRAVNVYCYLQAKILNNVALQLRVFFRLRTHSRVHTRAHTYRHRFDVSTMLAKMQDDFRLRSLSFHIFVFVFVFVVCVLS